MMYWAIQILTPWTIWKVYKFCGTWLKLVDRRGLLLLFSMCSTTSLWLLFDQFDSTKYMYYLWTINCVIKCQVLHNGQKYRETYVQWQLQTPVCKHYYLFFMWWTLPAGNIHEIIAIIYQSHIPVRILEELIAGFTEICWQFESKVKETSYFTFDERQLVISTSARNQLFSPEISKSHIGGISPNGNVFKSGRDNIPTPRGWETAFEGAIHIKPFRLWIYQNWMEL